MTGILHLTHKLDREDKDFLVVTVIAKDKGVPPLSSTATIFVTVQDINDNNPVFDPYELTYHAAEDAGVDTSICRITATDEDANNYGRIIYSFDVQNDDNTLKINRSSVSYMGLGARKPVFGFSNQVILKPASSATETS